MAGKARQGGRAGRPGRPDAWRAGALALAFFAVACAGRDQHPSRDYNALEASQLFAAGYHDIADVYIEEVDVGELALSGIEELDRVDPAFHVKRKGGMLLVGVDGERAGAFALPSDRDSQSWGSLTAAVVDAGRHGSDELGAASTEVIHRAVFDGILSRLDDYSRYAGAEEALENRASRDGFGGIGVRIRLVEAGVEVVSVMDGTPAAGAGLQGKDIITHIGGLPAAGLSQREVVHRLRGPVGSRVRLTLDRASADQPIETAVTRAHIVPQTVRYRPEGRIAHVRITGFNQGTARSLRDTIVRAKRRQGPDLVGVVLDLRGNPGGLLDQAVEAVDLFVSEGRIVSTHGRHPDSHQYFDADPDNLAEGLRVAVLVDANSASASEIVAAALQDAGRAVVIGSSSYGKGTVQTVLRLPNDGELTLTWARFHAPSGYALNQRGVLPDLCTSGEQDNVEAVVRALRTGTLPLRARPLQPAVGGDAAAQAAAVHRRCPLRRGNADVDLKVALAVLADPALYRLAVGEAEARLAAGPASATSTAAAHSAACRQSSPDPATQRASC